MKTLKLKLKAKGHKAIWQEMINRMYEGWKVVKAPRKNIFGTWVCKLKKSEMI